MTGAPLCVGQRDHEVATQQLAVAIVVLEGGERLLVVFRRLFESEVRRHGEALNFEDFAHLATVS